MQEKTLNLKNNLEKISIDFFKNNLPNLKNINETKTVVIGKWLSELIVQGINSNELKSGQLLPSKAEFAYNLGVSIGTIQTAFKYCDDFGCIDAKPCVGTVVKDKNNLPVFNRKTSSKRDKIISEIKKYIKSQNFHNNDKIHSPKIIAQNINQPINSVRLALENLCSSGILKHVYRNSEGQTGWYLIKEDFLIENDLPEVKTLVDKTVDNLKDYINKNCKRGDRIYSHAKFAKILNTSVSTVHTAYNILCKEGILKTRRGQYGTIIERMPYEKYTPKPETSIFLPSSEAVNYYYEKIQSQIKKMISQNYEIGDKLPPITELAKTFEISPNTVRKALVKISDEGYVKSLRGRYGGIIVTELPDTESQGFRWLAVNPQYAYKQY